MNLKNGVRGVRPVRVGLLDGLFGRLNLRILATRTGGRHFEKFGIYFVICRPYGVRKYAIKRECRGNGCPTVYLLAK